MCSEKQLVGVLSSSDDLCIQSEACEMLRRLADLPVETRGREGLRMAARLLEFAAFELAGRVASTEVGELIDMAADIEQRSAAPATVQVDAFAQTGTGARH